MKKTRNVAAFGDFQTPDELATDVLDCLQSLNLDPRLIVEPTCGKGSFLVAAARAFPDAELFGLDINGHYLNAARDRLNGHPALTLRHANFFAHDWYGEIERRVEPTLVLGNPPWVTNSALGSLGSDNLPVKSNFQNMKGFDALTGKSNFDISEYMLLENLKWLRRRNGTVAVLCKTAVARKVLRSAWKRDLPTTDARIYRIDAAKHFGAAVDACLFVMTVAEGCAVNRCSIYANIGDAVPQSTWGFADGQLVADIDRYHDFSSVRGSDSTYTWRSGLKHDCSKIMELDRTPDGLVNGLRDRVEIEETYLYPLIKSSDIAGAKKRQNQKCVIVTQKYIGEPTDSIKRDAPQTWAYLQANRNLLINRTSVIYRNKPDFSIFGVGDYSFTPWKIAISGLYKSLTFRI